MISVQIERASNTVVGMIDDRTKDRENERCMGFEALFSDAAIASTRALAVRIRSISNLLNTDLKLQMESRDRESTFREKIREDRRRLNEAE